MQNSQQKEKIFDEIKQSINFLLIEREKKEVSFEISDFFRQKLVNEILLNFDNIISQEEYVETVLKLIYNYNNGKKSDLSGRSEVERLIQQLKNNPKNPPFQNLITRIYPASAEIQILSSVVLESYNKLVTERQKSEEGKINQAKLVNSAQRKEVAESGTPKNKDKAQKAIWTIASGKGGTGKSIIAANIAVGIALLGYKVLLIDGDLGMPNLHNHLHIKRPKYSLDDFLSRKVTRLSNVIVQTPLNNLHFICGASSLIAVANIQYAKKLHLIKHISKLPADIVLVDIGSGASFNIVDLFNISSRGIVVSNPDPSAVQDAYFFLKNVVYRRIKLFSKINEPFKIALNTYLDDVGDGKIDIPKLLKFLNTYSLEIRSDFDRFMHGFHPRLIMNKMHSLDQRKESIRLVELVHAYMNVEMEYLGEIKFDECVIKSAKGISPFICQYPNEKVTKNMYSILKMLDYADLQYHPVRSFRKFRSRIMKLRDHWY
ncbi:hypothetical protein AMJ80_04740 [bacterium SM23_31]|nr:MAG: hypothetical protein AMJ80_04740 [bacterium SM23_31]